MPSTPRPITLRERPPTGFTLLEVIVFIVVAGLGATALMSLTLGGMGRASFILDSPRALHLASGRAEEILAWAGDDRTQDHQFNTFVSTLGTRFPAEAPIHGFTRTVTFEKLSQNGNTLTCGGDVDSTCADPCRGVCGQVTVQDANGARLATTTVWVPKW